MLECIKYILLFSQSSKELISFKSQQHLTRVYFHPSGHTAQKYCHDDPETTSRRRFDVIISLLGILHRVPDEIIHLSVGWKSLKMKLSCLHCLSLIIVEIRSYTHMTNMRGIHGNFDMVHGNPSTNQYFAIYIFCKAISQPTFIISDLFSVNDKKICICIIYIHLW